MDSQPPGLDFAIIGHQDSWENITSFVNAIRKPEFGMLTEEKIRQVFSFIPPRELFRVKVKSQTGTEINGAYIETFITPDTLTTNNLRSNLAKVRAAAACAEKLGARIVTLGGFTSIVLEGNLDLLSSNQTIAYTTGNTLTASFIVKGIEFVTAQKGIDLNDANVLIIGATGDIGQACVQYFKHKVSKLLLCARNDNRLKKLAEIIRDEKISVKHSTSYKELIAEADIIICVASTSEFKIENCKKGAIVCDAGYPKNIQSSTEVEFPSIFHGGMGCVSQGYEFSPDYLKYFYRFPFPYITHGCILEAMVLAFENKLESFSNGKGKITTENMEEIFAMSNRHGIQLAPLYNLKGLW